MATRWVIPRSPTMREIDEGWVLADEPAAPDPAPAPLPPARAPAPPPTVQPAADGWPLDAEASSAVDVNTATLEELTALQGIGPTLARRIIDARPYASLDDLAAVPRLGGKTLARLRGMLRVG